MLLSKIWRCGIYIRVESCEPPLNDGVEKTGDFNDEVPKGNTVKGAGESWLFTASQTCGWWHACKHSTGAFVVFGEA